MKTNTIQFIAIALIITACGGVKNNPNMPDVTAAVETEAVSASTDDDAADDPAIWYNEANPGRSLIVGTDKTDGLDIFALDGKLLQSHAVGRINNVDIRDGFMLDSTRIQLIGGSNRDTNSSDFWMIDESGNLTKLGSIPSQMPDVYGFAMYKSPSNGEIYAFINSKTGGVEQWKLSGINGQVTGKLVRNLKLPSQVEGMVADDILGEIYVGVEVLGIFKFSAEEGDPTEGKMLANSTDENENIAYDIEGLALYYLNDTEGYLIASSQGNFSYAVFEPQGDNKYLGSFEIVDGPNCDGVQETDGIDVTHLALGDAFPTGVFICQDGFNFDGEVKKPQNFKLVHWKDIADQLGLE